MFDISTVNRRYFNIKIDGLTLDVEPPKLKVLKKITALTGMNDEESMDGLVEAVGMILNKNKAKIKVSEELLDELDLDQLNEILVAYFEWLSEEKQSKN